MTTIPADEDATPLRTLGPIAPVAPIFSFASTRRRRMAPAVATAPFELQEPTP